MGKILQKFDTFTLWKVEQHDLPEFTKFVLRVNYEHHLKTSPSDEEIEEYIRDDERRFCQHSHSYALKTNDGKIFGTINTCLWDEKEELPIEREYKLNVRHLINTLVITPPQIWHIGRFAIDREEINRNETLKASQGLYFKLLLTCAFSHICTDLHNVMIAECDRKLHETVKRLKIFSKSLSDARFILGSETLPIINTGAGLLPFYEKHKHLLNYVS